MRVRGSVNFPHLLIHKFSTTLAEEIAGAGCKKEAPQAPSSAFNTARVTGMAALGWWCGALQALPAWGLGEWPRELAAAAR